MKKIVRLLLPVFLVSSFLTGGLFAQKINVTIPANANSKYYLIFNKGLKQDTVQSGTFSFGGSATITIPDAYKDYVGIAFLQSPGKRTTHLIMNHENFSANYTDNKFTFEDSPENTYLYAHLQKSGDLERNTSLYADRFIEMMQYMNALNSLVSGKEQSLDARFRIQQYAQNELDAEALYTSGLWFYIIDSLSKISGQEAFANDMVRLLGRTKSQTVFEALAADLLMIINQYGWDDAFDVIIPYIVETGRIEYPQGNMYAAFTMAKLRKGMVVPALEGLTSPMHAEQYTHTILFFYESDCPSCNVEIDKLTSNYPSLKSKKVRLISISADHNKAEYETLAKNFLWPDKLCDYKSFVGPNFSNYGILATPTYFLLDKDNKVIGRYAMLEMMAF